MFRGHLVSVPLVLAAALLSPRHGSGGPGGGVPFRYAEGFESDGDPVEFWVSYNKKYTVNEKGPTEEKARSGRRSFKLDVTFNETSRFLWRIPLRSQVPVAGTLRFSGHLLTGEETTGRVTLGVSFAFPPTHHNGCTAPQTFYTSTDGQWREVGEDIVARGRQIARSVIPSYQADLRGENVGVMLESLIFDLRGDAGQRVVLYADDLEVAGEIPDIETYRAEIAERWAPAKAAFERQLAAWRAALDDSERELRALPDLSPEAAELRDEHLARIGAARERLVPIEARGYLSIAEKPDIGGFAASLPGIGGRILALSEAYRAGRSVLVSVVPPISSRKILPDDRLPPGEIGKGLEATAARGEYEPASFVVSALASVEGLTVAVSDLRGPAGRIPARAVDVRSVKCWYQAGTAWAGIRQDKTRRFLIPELLLKDDALVKVDTAKQENYLKLRFRDGDKYIWVSDPADVRTSRPWPVDKYPVRDTAEMQPLDIPAAACKQVWLTIHVPDDCPDGVYEGSVTLQTGDTTAADIPLRVTVLPFDLLPPYYTSSMDYHGRLDPTGKGMISSWIKSREQFRNELADMVAHGLRNCQHYNISKEILGEVLRIREEVGMDNRVLYLKNTIPIGNPTDPDALAKIRENVRDILEFVKPYGTEEVYFYGMDERRGEVLASQRPAWTAVREAGGKIFVAGYEENVDMMGDVQDMHVRAGPPSRAEVEKWHALGHRIFCYANPQTGVENPVVYRRNYGLLLWKFDYDGAATNAYQHTFGATWNDFDHTVYRSHTIAYPTVDGVVDTIAWEGYREGVDDVRYITTLQHTVDAAAPDSDDGRRAVADARALLQRLKTGNEIETTDLASLRDEIVARLLDLHRTGAR